MRTKIITVLLFVALSAGAGLSAAFAAPEPAPLPPYKPDATAARGDIPDLYKWDLTPLFESEDAWREALVSLESQIAGLDAFKSRAGDPSVLADALSLYFRLHDETNRTTLYANLALATSQSDDHLQAMQQQSLGLMDKLMKRAAFLRPEILAIDDDAMERAYRKVPRLEEYRPYLDNLRRRRQRVLSPEVERVLSLAGDNLWAEIDLNEIPSPHEKTFSSLLTDIPWPKIHDEQGQLVQLTLSNYGHFRASEKRSVRREAVEAFLHTLHQYRHAFAGTLGGQYQFSVFLAQARGYDTALEAYLDKDALEPAVYKNLIRTVNENLAPLHRYIALRKKLLGLEDLHLYDLYVPLVPSADSDVPFPEARETILAALQPLGPEYLEVLERGTDPRNGWIDVYPSLNKQSGAFSASVYGRHPYVMVNYQDKIDDMFTLAHEFGHALHSHLAMTHQPYSSYRYVPFLAEIASTCNEALLGDYLIAHAPDKAQKAALLAERLEGIRTTIYRQALFAEFELRVHEFVEAGTPITAKLLSQTYGDLIRRYYGPDYTIDSDDDMEWAYIPHFYYKYYVFTYATGLSSGIAISHLIRSGGPAAVTRYLGMLEGGSSKAPLVLLKGAGVDLTTPEPIEAALATFSETMNQLQSLLP